MKRLHLALSVINLEKSITDYSQRLGAEPAIVIDGVYALWKTDIINLSIKVDDTSNAEILRHIGIEESGLDGFTSSTDCNGLLWESFSEHHQLDEIQRL